MPESLTTTRVALSLKQPWAALVVAGRKSIEIRTWATRFRGPVLIHAGKVPDRRPEAWHWINSPDLESASTVTGGIVGEASVVDCRIYRTQRGFDDDQPLHLNAKAWFQPPRMYGFEFRNPRPLPFVPVVGQTLFFAVKGFPAQ